METPEVTYNDRAPVPPDRRIPPADPLPIETHGESLQKRSFDYDAVARRHGRYEEIALFLLEGD
jgi:hypothetical protein